ncbi:nitroreductase [Enterovirga sp.]|uniref:nitroreductase n=1 Tax=Enterovirga sp. TaxID=2026350 RepID=UPI002BFC47DC|nr:nitroreductase [Enterovirga sp.]HMO29629.1 nitroreductase [Enterovirga sp.]
MTREPVEVLDELTAGRFTCRAYRPDPVPEEVIRGILRIAGRTPSWCNVQPWQVVVASAESTEKFRRALMEEARADPHGASDIPFPPGYHGIYKKRRQEIGYQLYAALGIAREDRERREAQSFENFRLFGAPHVAIVTLPGEIGPYAIADCGSFVGSFLLAARAHGVDTTPQAALAHHSAFIRRYFDIPDGQKILCGISFGYADKEHPANSYRTARVLTEEIARMV